MELQLEAPMLKHPLFSSQAARTSPTGPRPRSTATPPVPPSVPSTAGSGGEEHSLLVETPPSSRGWILNGHRWMTVLATKSYPAFPPSTHPCSLRRHPPRTCHLVTASRLPTPTTIVDHRLIPDIISSLPLLPSASIL